MKNYQFLPEAPHISQGQAHGERVRCSPPPKTDPFRFGRSARFHGRPSAVTEWLKDTRLDKHRLPGGNLTVPGGKGAVLQKGGEKVKDPAVCPVPLQTDYKSTC